ncbi:hypothetical protein KCH_63510 [Kitasatospora cheerisanensis KCTC 2395]|uniref:Phosphatase n=1 Tax=Kitasatospora cheerisanensis KCTC 2395 TaxID=1348663 RepID=A0A066YL60_9ACTN|nr:hypothetical protein KCH_63510 [Kitasatospora cheerisanensis KCTC 2395]
MLFDLDGTLVDSQAAIDRHTRRWAARHGLDGDTAVRRSHGLVDSELIALLAPSADVAAETLWLQRLSCADVAGITATAGAARLLEQLPPGSWAIVTSGTRRVARARLAAAELPEPEVLVTADDVVRGKPDPECFRRAAQALGVRPADCLVFEDAPVGLRAARPRACGRWPSTTPATPARRRPSAGSGWSAPIRWGSNSPGRNCWWREPPDDRVRVPPPPGLARVPRPGPAVDGDPAPRPRRGPRPAAPRGRPQPGARGAAQRLRPRDERAARPRRRGSGRVRLALVRRRAGAGGRRRRLPAAPGAGAVPDGRGRDRLAAGGRVLRPAAHVGRAVRGPGGCAGGPRRAGAAERRPHRVRAQHADARRRGRRGGGPGRPVHPTGQRRRPGGRHAVAARGRADRRDGARRPLRPARLAGPFQRPVHGSERRAPRDGVRQGPRPGCGPGQGGADPRAPAVAARPAAEGDHGVPHPAVGGPAPADVLAVRRAGGGRPGRRGHRPDPAGGRRGPRAERARLRGGPAGGRHPDALRRVLPGERRADPGRHAVVHGAAAVRGDGPPRRGHPCRFRRRAGSRPGPPDGDLLPGRALPLPRGRAGDPARPRPRPGRRAVDGDRRPQRRGQDHPAETPGPAVRPHRGPYHRGRRGADRHRPAGLAAAAGRHLPGLQPLRTDGG